MEITRNTNRDVIGMKHYIGSCDNCGVDLEYFQEFVVVRVFDDDLRMIVVPVDSFSCPACKKDIGRFIIYKSLDITEELNSLRKDQK
jgi:hypothetical protein